MLPLLQVGQVILSPDIITECFLCDLTACKGACCVEGESGAPLTPGEVGEIESALPVVWDDLSPKARAVIEADGVATTDAEGDLVTGIVCGKDCVLARREGDLCLCATERAHRAGRLRWCKPVSCHLYPIREKRLSNGLTALNYHRWSVCRPAVRAGRKAGIPLYVSLRDPLVRRFGADWYDELINTVDELRRQGFLDTP